MLYFMEPSTAVDQGIEEKKKKGVTPLRHPEPSSEPNSV
jgi:hypothetical protein